VCVCVSAITHYNSRERGKVPCSSRAGLGPRGSFSTHQASAAAPSRDARLGRELFDLVCMACIAHTWYRTAPPVWAIHIVSGRAPHDVRAAWKRPLQTPGRATHAAQPNEPLSFDADYFSDVCALVCCASVSSTSRRPRPRRTCWQARPSEWHAEWSTCRRRSAQTWRRSPAASCWRAASASLRSLSWPPEVLRQQEGHLEQHVSGCPSPWSAGARRRRQCCWWWCFVGAHCCTSRWRQQRSVQTPSCGARVVGVV